MNEKPKAKIYQFPQGKDLENAKAIKAMEKDVRDNSENNKLKSNGFSDYPSTRSVFDKYYENPNEGNENERLKYLKGLQGDRTLTPSLYLDMCKKTLPKNTYENILLCIMDNEIYAERRKDGFEGICDVVDAYFEIMSPSKTF